MIIRQATLKDIPAINRLAHETWWPTYKGVLSKKQISFMLKHLYSEDALKTQMNEGITFLIVERSETPVAFAAYSIKEPENLVYKLEKLYVLPSEQGMGTGRRLISEVMKIAKGLGGKTLELNVHRNNPAYHFYKKLGFDVYKIVDIPYQQFVLNDYIMRQEL